MAIDGRPHITRLGSLGPGFPLFRRRRRARPERDVLKLGPLEWARLDVELLDVFDRYAPETLCDLLDTSVCDFGVPSASHFFAIGKNSYDTNLLIGGDVMGNGDENRLFPLVGLCKGHIKIRSANSPE